jgi:hypothetical protein
MLFLFMSNERMADCLPTVCYYGRRSVRCIVIDIYEIIEKSVMIVILISDKHTT